MCLHLVLFLLDVSVLKQLVTDIHSKLNSTEGKATYRLPSGSPPNADYTVTDSCLLMCQHRPFFSWGWYYFGDMLLWFISQLLNIKKDILPIYEGDWRWMCVRGRTGSTAREDDRLPFLIYCLIFFTDISPNYCSSVYFQSCKFETNNVASLPICQR